MLGSAGALGAIHKEAEGARRGWGLVLLEPGEVAAPKWHPLRCSVSVS